MSRQPLLVEQEWKRLYEAGKQTAQEIATEYGVGVSTVYRALKRWGVVMRPSGRMAGKTYFAMAPLDLYEKEQIAVAYSQGKRGVAISCELGIPIRLVREYVRALKTREVEK